MMAAQYVIENTFGLSAYNLDDEELKAIGANGCGSKGGWIKIPNYSFGHACDHHDAAYWIGGDWMARWCADCDFLAAMLETAKDQVWYYRIHLEFAARRYYWAVRWFGEKHFNHGEPRTREDVDAAVVEMHRQERGR